MKFSPKGLKFKENGKLRGGRKVAKPKKKVSAWNVFIKKYAEIHPDIPFGQLSKRASNDYYEWKKRHAMVGGSIMNSINNFLWEYFAKPVGRAYLGRWGVKV